MGPIEETNILAIARSAVSIDGNAAADIVEEDAAGYEQKGEVSDKGIMEMRIVAKAFRLLGSTIHPLDCTIEKLVHSPAIVEACRGTKFLPAKIAEHLVIWLVELSSLQIADFLTGEKAEQAFHADTDISPQSDRTAHEIAQILKPQMGLSTIEGD